MRTRPQYVQVSTTRHGKMVTYFRRDKGPRIRLPLQSDPKFEAAYEAALSGRPVLHVRDMPVSPIAMRKQRTESGLRKSLNGAKIRSAQRGLDFDITLNWLLQAAEAQGFRCALTGIEFYAEHASTGKLNPYVPSLDRIDPRKGYTRGNVRIVILAINSMLMDWGTEIFEQVANSYRYQKNKKGPFYSLTQFPDAPHLVENLTKTGT